jgi:hypothetical protein
VGPEEARTTLEAVTTAWVEDPESDVVWAGEHERRWGIRMAQHARDFTTIWFDVGERTLSVAAYLLPDPPRGHAEIYRLCLLRNASSWPVAISLDPRGDLYVRGRLRLSEVAPDTIDGLVGAVYEIVELTFKPLVRIGFHAS